MDEEAKNKLIEDIYNGVIYVEAPPLNLYLETANKLLEALYQGYGYTLTEAVENVLNALPVGLIEKQAGAVLLRSLATNIYQFSAAKTFQNVADLQSLIYKDGFKVGFNEFKKGANQILDTYNKNWLKTEYRTATLSAAGAQAWNEVEQTKGQFPLLKYQTANDGNVRPEHARLDNIVKPVGDPFWNQFYPPNGWNCRCIVIQLGPGEEPITKISAKQIKEIQKEVPEVFRNNPGQTGKIFDKHHPYFDCPVKYAELKANNFNLPLPSLPMPKEVTRVAKKVNQFVPANTMAEVKERLLATGIKEVGLKGLELNEANGLLKAVEREHKIGGFNLDKLVTYDKKGNIGGYYSPSNNSIHINIKNYQKEKGFKVLTVETWNERIAKAQKVIDKYTKEYLGVPGYNQKQVTNAINRQKRIIKEIEDNIAKGIEPKPWAIQSYSTSSAQAMENLMTHELGHNRHYKNIGVKTDFAWSKEGSVSEYGETNKFEYLAEWFNQYRVHGPKGVPPHMVKIFENIK